MRSKNKRRNRVFLDAVVTGDAAAVKEMLLAGVSVEARDGEHGATALMLAVRFDRTGRAAVTALLLEAGADVNAIDATGRTPLMFAKAQYIPALLAAGAHINTQDDDGETAVMKAAAAADIEKAKALLENGADRTITDRDNRIARDYASDLGIIALTDLLAPYNCVGPNRR